MLEDTRTRRIACIAAMLLHCAACLAQPSAVALSSTVKAGMSIREAVRVLEGQGLQIYYSTDLVRSRMRVAATPTAREPHEVLAEILSAVGLGVRSGPNDSLLIVRGRALPEHTEVQAPAASAVEPPSSKALPQLEEIIVAASRYALGRSLGNSLTSLDRTDIEYSPEMGEDALRPISRLPGFAGNGVSSRNNVRGGEIGETLVRFDGLRLYEPFHLKDFQSIFSSLDPRVVSSIDVYTGAFPAAFGDRMSSVVDVASMTAPEDLYHELGLSFFNTSVLSAGRFADGNAEWVASARRSNLDLLYDAFSDQPERPRYVDTFAKLSYEISERLKISGNALYSRDDIALSDDIDREERAEADHSDAYYWLRLDHFLGPRLSGSTLIAHSHLQSERRGVSDKNGISRGRLRDTREFEIRSVQTDWIRTINDALLVEFGGIVDDLRGSYDYADAAQFDMLFDYPGAPTETERARRIVTAPHGDQAGVYASVRYSPASRITTDIGLRWDSQNLDGVRSSTLSPRVGVRFQLAERTELRASWGRFSQSQAINELQVNDGVTNYSTPQRADQTVIGLVHTLENGIGIRFEVYEKEMSSLRPRFENLLNSLILLPELKPDRIRIAPSSAHARGLELLIERSGHGPLSWRASYTRSFAEDTIDGQEILRSWDQRHALSAGLNWDTDKWNVGLAYTQHSGWPTSTAALDDTGPIPVADEIERNALRLQDYRSVDLQVTRIVSLESSELSVSFELMNLLDRENPCCVEYEIGDEEEAGLLLFKTLDYLPRIPAIGVLWKF